MECLLHFDEVFSSLLLAIAADVERQGQKVENDRLVFLFVFLVILFWILLDKCPPIIVSIDSSSDPRKQIRCIIYLIKAPLLIITYQMLAVASRNQCCLFRLFFAVVHIFVARLFLDFSSRADLEAWKKYCNGRKKLKIFHFVSIKTALWKHYSYIEYMRLRRTAYSY